MSVPRVLMRGLPGESRKDSWRYDWPEQLQNSHLLRIDVTRYRVYDSTGAELQRALSRVAVVVPGQRHAAGRLGGRRRRFGWGDVEGHGLGAECYLLPVVGDGDGGAGYEGVVGGAGPRLHMHQPSPVAQ